MNHVLLRKASLSALVLMAAITTALAQDDSSQQEQPRQEDPKTENQKPEDTSKKEAEKPEKKPDFKLVLRINEYRIRSGQLENFVIAKSFSLDNNLIERSEKHRKISTELRPTLEKIYRQLNAREPKDALFSNKKGNWWAEQQTGWKVDQEATEKKLLDAIMGDKPSSDLVIEKQEPRRSVQKFADQGILYHFGGGESSFKGSPDFRVTNIINGASKLHEQYIEAGKEFDFNKTVGDISKENGFVPGYVILGDKLGKEDGGGICQVSTTIFRAAYESGLPITERHYHSYWVHYYDPVGYEATVYSPVKNLKFKNDTDTNMFIQANWDKAKQTLRFDLFGPKPDRKVTVGKSQVSNVKPPAGPQYVADPSVRPGGIRQIDHAQKGVTVVIDRTVKYDSGEVKKDSIKSIYKPWGNIFAVNPSDPRAAD
ncbi:VanW family protein [Deinococcus cellulosilyticus]|uniref:Uncharacterized protein n=1 Tax=Deinococcus cellulosilyticus (strain DSM 18568 / NBRC 106333 / KACC 11606 / 5516J-15) TaxID=1223518 RepID=A0A511N6P9_DEIC1|nr:VanW family protein [Deinococcus cellulosilyticus]GEM48138.1 hypothetical protein DC3_37730 [Deinococcus cellulosilyticus NBRC 106333 = KACC 11606]